VIAWKFKMQQVIESSVLHRLEKALPDTAEMQMLEIFFPENITMSLCFTE
jgi:hypothetical protein